MVNDMKNSKRKPEIRFSGFTDDWKQHKLGDVCAITSGVMGDSLLTDGKYRLTRIETIADGFVDENKVGFTNIKPDDTYRLQKGDILYSNINSIGQMGKVAEYKGESILYHGINLLRLAPKDMIYPNFLLYLLNTPSRRKWADTHANQAVSQASINQTLLENQDIFICSKQEQIEIGNFLTKLDDLISLHQRKYSQILNIKQSMLEKMFPKDGAKVPEVRFAGFTDDWEQRKLGDIYEINNERNCGQFPVEKTISISTMTFNENGNGAADSSIDNYKVLRIGDIAFEGHTNKEYRYGRFVLNDIGDGIMSPRFTTLRPIIDQDFNFWKYYIHYENVMRSKLVNSTKAGTMMNELVFEDLAKQNILVPPIEEQESIGNFFRNLDDLIALHQRKLVQLQNIKKSCLDKMFIS